MLIIKIVLIYLLIGAIYWTRAFYEITKSDKEMSETMILWNNLTAWDHIVVLTRLIVKWPIRIVEGFSTNYKALVVRMEMCRIDKELKRRREKS